MSSQTIPTRMTPDEYLEWEVAQEGRHEYIDGEIRAMSGGSIDHNQIVTNLIMEAGSLLKSRRCRILAQGQRTEAQSGLSYFYPDVLITCSALKVGKQSSVLNPTAIFEVLSPSTQRYDRYIKFERYQEIESLQEYFLVHQNSAKIEAYRRSEEGAWDVNACVIYVGLGTTLVLESLGVKIPLSDIYYLVDLPETEEPSIEDIPEE